MATRTVYGNTHSENGWPMVDEGSCEWITVPGTNVSLQIQKGWPLIVLRAFAADFHAYVEPLRDADSACWTRDNKVGNSNHLSGTGMDLNWNGADGRTFRLGISEAEAYPGDKARQLRELLAWYEDIVFCGGRWSIRDWMHMQLNGNTYGNAARVQGFIDRKIRPDGFSTYRRGAYSANPVEILARAAGLPINRAAALLPAVSNGLKAAECTNANRIAMWLAQVGHESDNFNATAEYASGDDYDTRTDLGNTPERDGDGRLYKGRSWIQITGKHNYREFSKWAHAKGMVPTPDYFVVHPLELSELKWAGIGAAWYWTVARGTRINEASDRRDVTAVTYLINGGYNGIDDRRARFNRALAVGDQLLALLQGEDDILANPEIERFIREIHACLFNKTESWSPLATPGEGAKWTLHEKIHSLDGMLHPMHSIARAKAGDLDELHRIVLAAKGLGKDKSPTTVRVFQNVLAEIEASNPEVLEQYLAQKGAA
ncbi:M15 family metallopeptidase [Mycolicibacterium sp. S2-37]|uniref:glycoside hydrolase family 19 protein n=1 Tax=Mycolicibacterium sp. S2-37 TaxID=2810297 RepID=UPI001A93D537|nr:M15 family metallopeptidase [Mycolicibacterium sp. S2-37]MBO0676767.1 M15 family metallopeptidase [Mycolicibacterium sp. S2-37]